MERFKTLADAKAELIDGSPETREAWNATAPRRALSAMLIEARMRAGLSQSGLADLAGWDKGYVSRLEGATDGVPGVKTLAKYLAACGEKLEVSSTREDAAGQPRRAGSVTFTDPYAASAAVQAAARAASRRHGK